MPPGGGKTRLTQAAEGCRAPVGCGEPEAARRARLQCPRNRGVGSDRTVAAAASRCVCRWTRSAEDRGPLAGRRDGLRAGGGALAPGCGAAVGAPTGQRVGDRRDSSFAERAHSAPWRSRSPVRPARPGRSHDPKRIPVTTVARTLPDLADVLDAQALRRAGTEAEYTGRFHLTSLNAGVEGHPGRRGRKLMTAALEGRRHRTRSPLEDRFLRLIEKWGVEEPQTNVWIEGYELDFVWTRAGLVVELDGAAAHTTRAAFNADRLRDRRLWRAGLRTIRLTNDALDAEEEVLADLAQAGVSVDSWPRASS